MKLENNQIIKLYNKALKEHNPKTLEDVFELKKVIVMSATATFLTEVAQTTQGTKAEIKEFTDYVISVCELLQLTTEQAKMILDEIVNAMTEVGSEEREDRTFSHHVDAISYSLMALKQAETEIIKANKCELPILVTTALEVILAVKSRIKGVDDKHTEDIQDSFVKEFMNHYEASLETFHAINSDMISSALVTSLVNEIDLNITPKELLDHLAWYGFEIKLTEADAIIKGMKAAEENPDKIQILNLSESTVEEDEDEEDLMSKRLMEKYL